MRTAAALAVSVGLLGAELTFGTPQKIEPGQAIGSPAYDRSLNAVIEEIKFVGLRHIAEATAISHLSLHCGEALDSVRIEANVRALNRLGWFEDVSVETKEVDNDPAHLRLEFHVRENPLLTAASYRGSSVLTSQQIKKMLNDKNLSPRLGIPVDPVNLHRIAFAIQSKLVSMGHPDARVIIEEEMRPGQQVKVGFAVNDGPRLPVKEVRLCGHPGVAESELRKQMHEIAPDAWFAGIRDKNVFTRQKSEQDSVTLLTYLQSHGYPEARIGAPQVTLLEGVSEHSLPLFRRRAESGLSVVLPVEAGAFFSFGATEVSSPLQEKLSAGRRGDRTLGSVSLGQPFSERAVDSLRANWERGLRRNMQRHRGIGDYRVRAVPTLDGSAHVAFVRFDLDPHPPYVVRRIVFRGNQRFPDRYLRRRIGLREGQALDEYALEDGLGRLTRTGYFQPFKKEDIHIETHEAERTVDVTVLLREKGKQRVAFSGGREQFGSTLGIAYTIFNLLGMDELLSTQIDAGPESLQIALSLAKEGFLSSRGTLALSVFDTFVRPRFEPSIKGPFQTHTTSLNAGWSYAASDVDAVGINFAVAKSLTDYSVGLAPTTAAPLAADLRNATSGHSLGVGWTRYAGDQKVQLADSVSGGWLGGSENLLKSKAECGQIVHDEVFDRHNAWAFLTTMSAVGSYKGNMPVHARFFAGDDYVRGLRPGELGPYETVATTSGSGATTYSAVPAGADLVAASNLEYRFALPHELEGAAFFDAGSGLLLPNWLGQTRPSIINSTNGLLHASTGLELRWALPELGVPVRMNYSFNVLRLDRTLIMLDNSVFRLHNRFGALGWGVGSLF